jgi:hypothetical protein
LITTIFAILRVLGLLAYEADLLRRLETAGQGDTHRMRHSDDDEIVPSLACDRVLAREPVR